MLKGIEPKDDFPSHPRFEELLDEQHLLISKHTRKWLREEHHFPGPLIERAGRRRWEEEGRRTFTEKASDQVTAMLQSYQPTAHVESVKSELTRLMSAEAQRFGMNKLPEVE
jgi:trimethylamine--corrinoid protein Co-methyltransferase